MNKQRIIILFLIAIMMSPNVAFSANTNSKLKGNVMDAKEQYINKDWWDRFQDPILKGYIMKSAAANHDLKMASLRVQETQELVKQSFGKEIPSLGFNTNFERQETSANTGMGSFRLPSYSQSTYQLPLSVNYELDLWRKNREKTIQVTKELESMKYDEKATYISLTSAVAAAYFNVIGVDRQLDLQKEIVKLRKDILSMTKENYNYGLSPATDVVIADRSLADAQSGLNDLHKEQETFLNELAALTSDSVIDSASLKRGSIDSIETVKNLPTSFKSDVIMQRPDILKAEAQLQKSKIDVDLARKDFLPDINIVGDFGFNSNTLSKALDWDSHIASIGVGLTQSLFAGGQKRAWLKNRKFYYQEMLESYQKTILTSFQEVNDSLAALKWDLQKNDDNLNRIILEKENLGMTNMKYEKGAISYLDTLQYKENVLTLERDQIQSKTNCLIDSLSLYKAVGGQLK